LYLIFIIPDLFINLLSNNIAFHQIYYQYTAIITPFLFIATIHGIQRLSKISFRIHPLYAICYMLFATLVSAYLYGPLPGAQFPNIDMFIKPQPNAEVINTFLRHIPKRYSIAATNNLGSHLSHRQKIFTIPTGIDQADIVMFLLNDKLATPSLAEKKKIAENMKHDKKYKKTFELGDFVAFEKIQ